MHVNSKLKENENVTKLYGVNSLEVEREDRVARGDNLTTVRWNMIYVELVFDTFTGLLLE
jgi:hypothetical protein